LLSSFAWSGEKKFPSHTPTQKKAGPAQAHNSLNPPDGSHTHNPKPTISAEFEDEGAGVNTSAAKLTVDGVDVTASAQTSTAKITYTPPIPLADGVHKVKLEISDEAGNTAAASWSFTLRTRPPEVRILSHKLVQFVNQSPILVTGEVDDAEARVAVNGIPAVMEGETFTAKVDIVEGKNTVIAEATDSFGNSGSYCVAVILDSKQPAITIASHPPNSLINARSVTVSGSVDKKASSVTVTTSTGGRTVPAPVRVSEGVFSAKDVQLEEGPNTITATAVSLAGNVGSSTIKITVDNTPPKISITAPSNSSMTNKKLITVTGTVDDPTAMVEINNTPLKVIKGMFTLANIGLVEGDNIITVTAADQAGNQAQPAFVAVLLKTTLPAPPVLDKLPTSTRQSAIAVTGITEPGSQVEIFMSKRSKGTVVADKKGAFSLKVMLIEGTNDFSAVATDAVGNLSAPSLVANVYRDTISPKIL
jgi:hypothetical protein